MSLNIGGWYDANVFNVENEALVTGGAPNSSDAYTINGFPVISIIVPKIVSDHFVRNKYMSYRF